MLSLDAINPVKQTQYLSTMAALLMVPSITAIINPCIYTLHKEVSIYYCMYSLHKEVSIRSTPDTQIMFPVRKTIYTSIEMSSSIFFYAFRFLSIIFF